MAGNFKGTLSTQETKLSSKLLSEMNNILALNSLDNVDTIYLSENRFKDIEEYTSTKTSKSKLVGDTTVLSSSHFKLNGLFGTQVIVIPHMNNSKVVMHATRTIPKVKDLEGLNNLIVTNKPFYTGTVELTFDVES